MAQRLLFFSWSIALLLSMQILIVQRPAAAAACQVERFLNYVGGDTVLSATPDQVRLVASFGGHEKCVYDLDYKDEVKQCAEAVGARLKSLTQFMTSSNIEAFTRENREFLEAANSIVGLYVYVVSSSGEVSMTGRNPDLPDEYVARTTIPVLQKVKQVYPMLCVAADLKDDEFADMAEGLGSDIIPLYRRYSEERAAKYKAKKEADQARHASYEKQRNDIIAKKQKFISTWCDERLDVDTLSMPFDEYAAYMCCTAHGPNLQLGGSDWEECLSENKVVQDAVR